MLITTAHRGVFFGYTKDTDSQIVETKSVNLERARNCVYWPVANKGFLGLAADGPADGARVGPPADQLLLLDVTSAGLVSPIAIDRWEAAPWK